MPFKFGLRGHEKILQNMHAVLKEKLKPGNFPPLGHYLKNINI